MLVDLVEKLRKVTILFSETEHSLIKVAGIDQPLKLVYKTRSEVYLLLLFDKPLVENDPLHFQLYEVNAGGQAIR